MNWVYMLKKKYPVVLEDQILYWMRGSHDSDIRHVTVFKGRIDINRLERAIRLCLCAEPVLGSRFVPGMFRSYWEQVKDFGTKPLCTLVESSDYDDDFGRFMTDTPGTDLFCGPQIKCFVLRSKNDTLLIKINHVAGDGGGLKDFMKLLSSTYSRLLNNPDYIPTVNNGRRGFDQVWENLSYKDNLKILRRSFRDAKSFLFPPKYFFKSLGKNKRKGKCMIVRRIKPDDFRGVINYAKNHGATLNDIMVAAHLRSFFTTISPDAFPRLVITADVRRYIPGGQAEAVCNLSGFFYLNPGNSLGSTFNDTLKIVHKSIGNMKDDYLAMGNFPLTTMAFKSLPFPAALWLHNRLGNLQKKQTMTKGVTAPLFTNTGPFEPDRLVFDELPVNNAYITTTVAWPPVVSLCLSGFKGGMTMTTGFCESFIKRQQVEAFLDKFINELITLTL